jgi:hypothetical protein
VTIVQDKAFMRNKCDFNVAPMKWRVLVLNVTWSHDRDLLTSSIGCEI